MAPYFSEKQLLQMHLDLQSVGAHYTMLQIRVTSRTYKSERGHEHAMQGFGRRLRILHRAINQVFTILPPEREDIPQHDEVVDATVAIQSFIMNVVGCLDNLAWIWVYENDVKAKDGKALDPKSVGLWKTHEHVRSSLPKDFRDVLDSRDQWFQYVKDFRDSLVHRIPLYIPPYIIDRSTSAEYDRLEHEAKIASDFEQYDRARAEQRKLVVFRPWITHSIYEQAPFALFHQQLLIDFTTINELGNKMLNELDRDVARQG